MVFGNPEAVGRKLQKGDIIIMELAAGYRGYSAQVGSPICVGKPPANVQKFWDEIAKPGYEKMVAEIGAGQEGRRYARRRPVLPREGRAVAAHPCHGIDFVSDAPHVYVDKVECEPFEEIMKPGMVIMAEPNPITPDGQLGMFVGHTMIVTETGYETVDDFPLELVVA